MIFDDVFYPENPRKRQEVANLRGEITTLFRQYKNTWNENADLLNAAFQQAAKPGTPFYGVTLRKLEKNINADPVGACIEEINAVISDSDSKMKKLMDDIGVTELLPNDWKEKGAKLEDLGELTLLKVCKIISTVATAAAAAYLGFYIFQGISITIALISAIGGVAASVMAFMGGALLSTVISAAAFIVTDMIASAITGAIERKQLNEAIDSLKKLRDDVLPLQDAAIKLAAVTQSIKDGSYKLAPGWYLMKDENGNYVIFRNGRQLGVAFAA